MKKMNLSNHVLAAWQTNNRVTEFFFQNLPDNVWDLKIPGAPRRTVRMIAGHIHNARCMWIKMLGIPFAVKPPKSVNRRNVTRVALIRAFRQSNKSMTELLRRAIDAQFALGSDVPWINIPTDPVHFMTYLVTHEAHHRGQIVLVARALNHRLSPQLTAGLWQWKKLHREVEAQQLK